MVLEASHVSTNTRHWLLSIDGTERPQHYHPPCSSSMDTNLKAAESLHVCVGWVIPARLATHVRAIEKTPAQRLGSILNTVTAVVLEEMPEFLGARYSLKDDPHAKSSQSRMMHR